MVFSFLTKQNNKHSEENILEEVFLDKINIPTLEMLVGLNDEGTPVTYDLATAPHLLTAGGTGSGAQKSINTMYLSLMEHNTPDDLKLIIIDNFGTEFMASGSYRPRHARSRGCSCPAARPAP